MKATSVAELTSETAAALFVETQRRIQALLKRGPQQDRDFENLWSAALDTLLER
jgi:hypothetical protein